MTGEPKLPGLAGSMFRGGVGLALVGVAAFSVWAFGKGRLGTREVYGGVASVFLLLGTFFLYPLAGSPWRFIRSFFPAFLAYCAVWCLAWFQLGFGTGEWLGSAGGSLVFALVLGVVLRPFRTVPLAALVLFVFHSAGYFLGGMVYKEWGKSMPITSMLTWGLIYGLGLGTGVGYAYHAFGSEWRR